MKFKALIEFYLSLTHVICLIRSHREAIYLYFAPLRIHLNRMSNMVLPYDHENGTLPFKKILRVQNLPASTGDVGSTPGPRAHVPEATKAAVPPAEHAL